MKICPKLLSELNFEPTRLKPCCIGYTESIPELYYNENLSAEEYIEYVHRAAVAMQDEETCKNCTIRQSVTAPDDFINKISIRTLLINHHRTICNCECIYCILGKPQKRSAYTIFPILQRLYAANLFHPKIGIGWGGGESSILPEFESIAEWALANNWRQGVLTNAIRFSPAIANILGRDMGNISISLDCGSSEVYRKVKGIDAFELVLRNIRRYREAAQKADQFLLKYIMLHENNDFAEIDRFFALVASLGPIKLEVAYTMQEYRNGTVPEKSKEGVAYFCNRAAEQGLPCIVWQDRLVKVHPKAS